MTSNGYQILNESMKSSAMRDKLLQHLKLPMAKLQQNKEVDEASIDEAARLIGKEGTRNSLKELQNIYKGALKDAKLIPEQGTTQIIGAFKASRRSLIIFKYDYVVFQLVQAVKHKYGKPLWLVCRVVWVKEPGESEFDRAGGFAVLFER